MHIRWQISFMVMTLISAKCLQPIGATPAPIPPEVRDDTKSAVAVALTVGMH